MSNSFLSISTETVFNIEDQLEDILNSLNTDVLEDKAGYQVYLMLFHYKDNCFYNYSKRTSIWRNGQREKYNSLNKFDELFKSNFGSLKKDLLKNYKFNGGKDFIENNLEKITNGEAENVCKKLLSFLKNQSDRDRALNGHDGNIMEHIKKCLDIGSDQILKDSLLKIFRSLPQPKNALIAGWMYSYISLKNTGKNTTNNTNCFKVLDENNNIIFIPNMDSFFDEHKNKFLKINELKYYFEDCYPLAKFLEELLSTGGSLEIDVLKKMSAVLFPLYDFGQFRGLISVATDNEHIDEQYCDNDNSADTKSLNKNKANEIRKAIQAKQERYRLKIRDAMKCELNKRVFKDNLEDDVYTKILRNLHLVQNILLAVYSKFEDDNFIPVALRSFKKLKNNIPQLVYLDEDNLKNKDVITLENGQSFPTKNYSQDLKEKIRVKGVKKPKVYYTKDGTDFLIITNKGYRNNIGSEIGLEILVPILAKGQLKGAFDLYYPPMKDTVSNDSDVRAIVEHLRTFLSLGGVHDEMVTRVTKHSIRAAVSAIISRNHSHHIGSHVTPRATVGKIVERLQYLGYKSQGVVKIASMRKAVEKARQEIDQRTIEIEYAMEDLKDLVEEVSSSFKEDDKVVILLKTRLDKYIQQKADFTAEIGTEPLITTKSASFFREIFIPFLENTLMLDGIGANEGVRYKTLLKNRLKLHLLFNGAEIEAEWNCSKDKSPHKYPYHSYPYSGHCTQCGVPTELKELKQISGDYKKDIKIAVPGPLGEFAIYSILENFIRNAIKHNRRVLGLENGGRDGLDIFIDIIELDKDDPDRDDYYKVQIWDNLTNPCEPRKIATDVGEKTVTLKKMLATLIKRSIVDNQGKLKKGAWGIAEMKIMATLLRGSDDFSNMANLRVGCYDKNGQGRLVYEFYVMKPKEIAVISDTKIHETKRNSLRANGVWYFSGLDEFSHNFKEGKSIASFQFVIFNKPEPEKLTDRVLARLPSRVIIKKCSEDLRTPNGWSTVEDGSDLAKSIAECASAENIINETWKHWIRFLMKKHKLDPFRLMVYLQQNKNDDPTKQWRELVKKCSESMQLSLEVAYDGWKNTQKGLSANGCFILVYDRHAGMIKDIRNEKIGFYEAVDKGSSDFSNIFAKPTSCITACEFAEAGMLNVLVMDERIAERAHDIMDVDDGLNEFLKKEPSRIKLAKMANISLCTHLSINKIDEPLHEHVVERKPCMKINVGLDKKDGKLSINLFQTFYGGKNEDVSYDIAIIHQGVLEGFIRDNIAPFSYDDFLRVLREKIPYIVITSGRGIPHDVPDSAKFLPFSLLEDFVIKGGIAKYRLTRVIMELIRRDV